MNILLNAKARIEASVKSTNKSTVVMGLAKGQTVIVKWSTNEWYAGIIKACHSDGSVTVEYNDGSIHKHDAKDARKNIKVSRLKGRKLAYTDSEALSLIDNKGTVPVKSLREPVALKGTAKDKFDKLLPEVKKLFAAHVATNDRYKGYKSDVFFMTKSELGKTYYKNPGKADGALVMIAWPANTEKFEKFPKFFDVNHDYYFVNLFDEGSKKDTRSTMYSRQDVKHQYLVEDGAKSIIDTLKVLM